MDNDIKKVGENKFKLNSIFNYLILIAFVALEIYVSSFHEYWADEAQAWLIARDTNILELFSVLKYESTPVLWYLILKIFMVFKLPYEYFYIVPIIFSALGIYLVLFKTKFPWYIKLLFTFSYFIFYQNTVICRNYCLVLPLIMLVCINYKDRFEKPYRFTFSLILFMNISAHTYLLSGSIYFLYIVDSIRYLKKLGKEEEVIANKSSKNNDIKNQNISSQNDSKNSNKVKVLRNKEINLMFSIMILFVMFLLILIMLFPDKNMGFGGNSGEKIFKIIGRATFADRSMLISIISTIFLLIVLFKSFDKIEILRGVILFAPLILFLTFVHSQIWHISVLFVALFFFLSQKMDKKWIKFFLTAVLVVQCIYSVTTIQMEKKNSYSSGEKIAEFLKSINLNDKKIEIFSTAFQGVSIQPYFEKNIFYLYDDKSYYRWTKDFNDKIDQKYQEKYDSDIVIIPVNLVSNEYTKEEYEGLEETCVIRDKHFNDLINHYQENGYVSYQFVARHVEKLNYPESQVTFIFVKKEISEMIDKDKYPAKELKFEYLSNYRY